jgi:hypothetical protein
MQGWLMPPPNLENLRTRPLRTVLACVVRGVRRVLPLAQGDETRVSHSIGLSDLFAAGAQIEPIELEEALEAFRTESDLDRISDRTRIARGAIEQLNMSTAYAAHILMIADQSPRSLAEAIKERRQPAFAAAAESFAAAWHAAEGVPRRQYFPRGRKHRC